MDINFGEGGVANCVLSPPFICPGKEHITNNYISKISDISDAKSVSIQNEILISNVINEIPKISFLKSKNPSIIKKWLNKHYSIIEDYCVLEGSELLFNSKLKNCNIKFDQNYIILYSLNGSCLPLKEGDKVIVDDDKQIEGTIKSVGVGTIDYTESKNKKVKSIPVNLVHRFCGDLFVEHKYVLYNNFGTAKMRHKNFKHLLQGIYILYENSIIHGDIKLENLICNDKGEIRIIDFGGALCLDKIKINKNEYCVNYEYNNDYINNILLNMFTTYTPRYTPIEVIVLKLLLRNYDKNQIMAYINEKLDSLFFKNIDIQKIENMVNFIIDNKTEFLKNAYCQKNSLLYKYDVYSMGIVFYEICKFIDPSFESIDKKTINLINSMIEFDYTKRKTIKQCLY